MAKDNAPLEARSMADTERTELSLEHHIGQLFNAIATPDFYPSLMTMLGSQVPFDDAYVVMYRHFMKPSCCYAKPSPLAPDLSDRFVSEMFERSPFYYFCQDGGNGFTLLSEIAPVDFEDSLYFHDYMLPSNLNDDAVFSIHGDGGSDFIVFMGRSTELSKYTEADAIKMRRLEPIVERAVLNHDILLTQVATDVIQHITSSGELESKFNSFTSEALTDREREIVGYLIRGFSSKACARELDISTSTERVHRKNIYEKLRVTSQSELLARVFDTLFY